MKNKKINLKFLQEITQEIFFQVPELKFPSRYTELIRQINRSPIKLRQNFYIVFISVWNIKQKVTVSDVFYYSSIDDPLGLQLPKKSAASNPQLETRKQAKLNIQALYQPNTFTQITSSKTIKCAIATFCFFFFIRLDKQNLFHQFSISHQIDSTLFQKNLNNNKNQLEFYPNGILLFHKLPLENEILGFNENNLIRKIESQSSFLQRKKNTILVSKEKTNWSFIPLGIRFENNDTIFDYRPSGSSPFSFNNKTYQQLLALNDIQYQNLSFSRQQNQQPFIGKSHLQNVIPLIFLPYFLFRVPVLPLLVLWWSYKFDTDKKKEIKHNLLRIHNLEKSKIKTFIQKQVTFRDIGGMDQLKKELSTVAYLLRKKEYNTNYPTGYLFAGPPGTGKTLMAKAMAYEAQTPYVYVEGSQFQDQEMGIANARVDDLFQQIQTLKPCILYIDEIDSIGEKREESNINLERLEKVTKLMEGKKENTNKKPSDTILMQFLIYMDGYSARKDLVIIGATNRLEILDDALLRPGRFDRQILFSPPFFRERLDILKIFLGQKPFSDNHLETILAERSMGLNGCDLRLLADNLLFLSSFQMNEKRLQDKENTQFSLKKQNGLNEEHLTFSTINKAFDRISRVRHNIADYHMFFVENDFLRTAYHEVGKAFIHTLLPEAAPIYSISVFPKPLNERFLEIEKEKIKVPSTDIIGTNNLDYFIQKIVACLSGRAIESVAFKENISEVSTYLNKPFDPDLYAAYKITYNLIEFGILDSNIGLLKTSNDSFFQDPIIERAFSRINSFLRKRISNKNNKELRKITKKEFQKPDYQEFWYDQDYPWEFDFIQNNHLRKNQTLQEIDLQTIYVLHILFKTLCEYLESNIRIIDDLVVLLLRNQFLSQQEIYNEMIKNHIQIPEKSWKAW
jgi:ATP-dependent Zn protease